MDCSIRRLRRWLAALGFGVALAMGIAPAQAQELCGGVDYPFPYTDVSAVGAAFCPGIMEAYVTGVSKGTTPTTFSPNNTVTRVQMTTFLQRSLDQGLARTSRRAAVNQWAIPQNINAMQTIPIGTGPEYCAADGENIWASAFGSNEVVEVQASSGKVLGSWTSATFSTGVLVAAGKVFAAGHTLPGSGNLYLIDPTLPPGAVAVAANTLDAQPNGIAFDGTHIWSANVGPNPGAGSVSIITLQASTPYPVTTVSTGFNEPVGIVYDGAHIWVADQGAGTLLKLDSAGAILQTVRVGTAPSNPAFDGTNLWVPNESDSSITVVQANSGTVVATLTANANNLLSGPTAAAFDGERVLVTNDGNNSVTVFKAADLSLIANVAIAGATTVTSACSDGINFWITLFANGDLLRF